MRATQDTGSATEREGALGPWAATQGALPVATCTAAGKPEHRAWGPPGADTLRAQTDWMDAGSPSNWAGRDAQGAWEARVLGRAHLAGQRGYGRKDSGQGLGAPH